MDLIGVAAEDAEKSFQRRGRRGAEVRREQVPHAPRVSRA